MLVLTVQAERLYRWFTSKQGPRLKLKWWKEQIF